MIYLTLFYEFFKIGLFSIGGGLATLPFLYVLADKYPWFSVEMLVDMIAISESTPGPIGINMATYAGFNAAGIPGGVIATLSIILPSLFIMMVIVRVLDKFRNNHFVNSAFYGLRPAVTALIASAGIGIAMITLVNLPLSANFLGLFNYKQITLFAVLFTGAKFYKKLQPIHLIGVAALAGMVFRV